MVKATVPVPSLIDEIENIKKFLVQSRKLPIVRDKVKTDNDEIKLADKKVANNDGIFWADIVLVDDDKAVCENIL